MKKFIQKNCECIKHLLPLKKRKTLKQKKFLKDFFIQSREIKKF